MSRANRRAALKRALKRAGVRPTRRRRRNPKGGPQSPALAKNRRLLAKAKEMGYKGTKRSTAHLEQWIASHSVPKSAAKKPTRRRRRKGSWSAKARVGAARRSLRGRRKKPGSKYPSRPATTTLLRRALARVERSEKELTKAMASLKRRPQQRRRRKARKARKNPTMNWRLWARRGGQGLAGFTAGNLASSVASKALSGAWVPAIVATHAPKIAEFGAPAALAFAVHHGSKKGWYGRWVRPDDAKYMIAGIAGSVAARNVPMIASGLARIPVIGKVLGLLQSLPSRVGLGLDLYAGAAGIGAYVATPIGPGMGAYVREGMGAYVREGMGAYVQTGPIELTAGEEESELYEEAHGMLGLGAADLAAEKVIPDAGQKIIRSLPAQAYKLSQARIGQVIGESKQLPGTVLVAVTVAGRDVGEDLGPAMVPDFAPGPIPAASNIAVSPSGLFSESVFTPSLPNI